MTQNRHIKCVQNVIESTHRRLLYYPKGVFTLRRQETLSFFVYFFAVFTVRRQLQIYSLSNYRQIMLHKIITRGVVPSFAEHASSFVDYFYNEVVTKNYFHTIKTYKWHILTFTCKQSRHHLTRIEINRDKLKEIFKYDYPCLKQLK